MPHGLPNEDIVRGSFNWPEAGLNQRRQLAKKFSACRFPAGVMPNRNEMAQALLTEGKRRIGDLITLYNGLMQIEDAMRR